MDLFWSALGAISTTGATLILLIAGIYARSQVNEARVGRNITLLLEFQRQYHSLEFREFRARLLDGEFGDPESFDPNKLDPPDRQRLWMLVDQLQFIGNLVERRLLDFDLVLSSFHSTPPKVWNAVRPYILRRRNEGSPLTGIYLEKLAQKYSEELPGYIDKLNSD